jgi:hypothetical protein
LLRLGESSLAIPRAEPIADDVCLSAAMPEVRRTDLPSQHSADQ